MQTQKLSAPTIRFCVILASWKCYSLICLIAIHEEQPQAIIYPTAPSSSSKSIHSKSDFRGMRRARENPVFQTVVKYKCVLCIIYTIGRFCRRRSYFRIFTRRIPKMARRRPLVYVVLSASRSSTERDFSKLTFVRTSEKVLDFFVTTLTSCYRVPAYCESYDDVKPFTCHMWREGYFCRYT